MIGYFGGNRTSVEQNCAHSSAGPLPGDTCLWRRSGRAGGYRQERDAHALLGDGDAGREQAVYGNSHRRGRILQGAEVEGGRGCGRQQRARQDQRYRLVGHALSGAGLGDGEGDQPGGSEQVRNRNDHADGAAVRDLCSLGVQRAAHSGQWLAIACSNFCGPQFAGMWRDKALHQSVTLAIRSASISPALPQGRL